MTYNNILDPVLYPPCKKKGCPFCGCMGDNTCKLHNVMESAPHLIIDYAEEINYCDRPKIFLKEIVQRECRICGCTWLNGCRNGCYWIEDDLCSNCSNK